MRIFKNKWFDKFIRKAGIGDEALKAAVEEIEAGNIDANLGGGVYKQRVARSGQGKRVGFRTIVLVKQGEKAFFVYGFAKNERDNISDKEVQQLKAQAVDVFGYTNAQLQMRLDAGSLTEVV